MELVGVKELKKAFSELPKATQSNVVRRTLKSAAMPVADAANRLAPKNQGNLSRSYTVSTKLTPSQKTQVGSKPRGEIRMYIGPNYKRGTKNYAPHAHLAEFGTIDRFHKSGKHVGHTPAQPHFRPAWETYKHQIIVDYSASMKREIDRAAARLARKTAKRKGG